jgi:hypothetical protein
MQSLDDLCDFGDYDYFKDNKIGKKFEFLDDFYLTAEVNTRTGKQNLIITYELDGKINDSSKIECIHTAICEIPASDYEIINNNPADFLRIKSSENRKEINLEISEKFKAFKSWVAGISEAKHNAFEMQAEIEEMGNITAVPLAKPLIQFVCKHDNNYLPKFIEKIEKECQHEGTYHFASLTANLKLITQIENSLDYVLSADLPWEPEIK